MTTPSTTAVADARIPAAHPPPFVAVSYGA